ncbi:MAG: hypothetical protein LBS20_03905 [Prevotella sp.]|jgi:hypothetical protein|nr:hypothetical protein [Prevotella sp.]
MKIKIEKNKKNVVEQENCPFSSKEDCPFSEVSPDCKWKKDYCFHKEKKVAKNKWDKTDKNIFLIISLGIILFIISMVLKGIDDTENATICNFFNRDLLYNAILSLSVAFLASAFLAKIIDIPGKLDDYEDSFINALSSDNYLKKLTEGRLTKLRSDITDLLHKKDVPNMPKGVILLDQQICTLLKKPYFKIYRQTIKCEVIELAEEQIHPPSSINTEAGKIEQNFKKYIQKDVVVEYTIHNPYDKSHPTVVDLGFSNHILKEEGINIKQYFDLKEFTLYIDGASKKYNVLKHFEKKEIKIGSCDLPTESEFYNKKIFIFTTKENRVLSASDFIDSEESDSEERSIPIEIEENIKKELDGFKIIFKDKITVKMHYTIAVPINDLLYTKRLRHPVKYFRLDYSFNHTDSKLFGQLIGTLIDQSKISTNMSEDGKHLSIETFDWLLPKNGVVVVMSSKKGTFT